MIDILIVGVIAISALIGLFRGFFPELLSLLTWVVAVWSGWNFSELVEPYITGKLNSPFLELWVSRGMIFVAVLLIGGLIGQLVALAIRQTGLSGTDRSLGLLFGLVRGVVIFGVAVLFAGTLNLSNEPWWQESRAIPYGVQVADWIHSMLPEQLAQHLPNESAAPAVEPADPSPEQL
ncbi:MAG: CvpA family protein [Gammaproteobacteria bacterium]|nr:CvpA family protein [Gammaproteobacteria bacterium]MDH3767513.1 CvpA family protein [Gammaproteobacteria bacterium]